MTIHPLPAIRLLFLLWLSTAFLLTASPLEASPSHAPGAPRLAQVRYIKGGLAVQPPHAREVTGRLRMALFAQYGLQTASRQRASLGFHDGTALHMNQRTSLQLRSPHVTFVRGGEVDEQLAPGSNHRVQTAAAVASAIGTNFDVKIQRKATVIVVVHGAVMVKNKAGAVLVKAGQQTTATPGAAPTPPKPADTASAVSWTSGIPQPDLGENLALDANGGRIVAASSENPGAGGNGNAQALADGRLDTEWETASGQTSNQWVKIALPGTVAYDLNQLLVDPGTGRQPANAGIKDFEFRVSTTGSNDADFSTVFSGTVQPKNGLQPFRLSGVRARYVELVAKDNGGNTQHITVAELEVVGKPSSQPLFRFPGGVATDAHGDVFVTEGFTSEVHEFAPDGTLIASWGSTGSASGQFRGPAGVAADSQGNAYVVDKQNDRIVKLARSGAVLAQWGAYGTGPGQFFDPEGVAVDGQGNVYVADYQNNRIQKLSPQGQPLTQWGSYGTGPRQFELPWGVAVDGQGNVYVADSGNNRISKFSSDGTLLAQWGTKGSGPGQLSGPRAVAVDAAGNIYVADTGNDRIQKFSPSGQPLAQWGSHGSGHGQFSAPNGIAVDPAGNIYVTDSRLQKLSANGQFLREWK